MVDGDVRRSYAELLDRADRLASALRALGLGPHDRVAALCPNVPELLELHHAVPFAGGVLVAINFRLSAAEVGHILEHSGARWLFVDPELEPLASGAPAGLEIVRAGGGEYERLVASGDPAGVPSSLRDEEEPIAIDYTSGTTGLPKGVVYTYRGAYLNALGEVIEAELGHHPVYLWTLPMFHCNGWCFPWAVTAAGGTHVCLRQVDPALIWRLLREEGVTHYCGSPTVQMAIVNHPDATPLERRVTALVAAAPPSPTLLARLEELDIRVVHVYGLTETYGPHTVCTWQDGWDALPAPDRARLLARQGQAYTTADLVRVVDEEMRDVPRDGATMGEVVMRGNNVMAGYFADPEATARGVPGRLVPLRRPRRLASRRRDRAARPRQGHHHLRRREHLLDRGRADDLRPSGGAEGGRRGDPGRPLGRAAEGVRDAPGRAPGERAELVAFCRERLAHFKCPDAIEFGPLPKTSTGKVQKFVLREPEWAGRERRIN